MSGNTLDDSQRRLLLGICLIIGAITFVPATYNFVIHPMLEGLGASESQSSLLRQLPSTAALLVIFLAGVLGNRWGERRVITICAIGFTTGTALVTVAPVFPVVVVGLVLQGATGSALVVIALGLLSSRISNPKARASAFSTFALAGPVVFGILPVVAGYLLDSASWRWIPAIWTLGGLVIIWSSRRLLTVAILIPFAYLFFYLTVGYQYVFGLDTLQTAIAMTSEQVASDYSVPVVQVNEISTAQGEAMVAGLHTLAVTGLIIAGACVVIFAVGRWRQGRVVSAE